MGAFGARGIAGVDQSITDPRARHLLDDSDLGLLVSLTALNATIPSRLAFSVFDYSRTYWPR